MSREQYRPATCHPDRRHAAKGLCFPCYQGAYPKAKRATCHPDRIAISKGLCRSCYDRWLRERNPEYADRQRQNQRRWADQNSDADRQRQAEWSKSDRGRAVKRQSQRDRTLAAFGLTREDEERMLEQQGGGCGVCGSTDEPRSFDIDHDHETGAFRGLLCGRCNKGLGLLGDTEHSVKQALIYLRRTKDAG